MKHILHIEYWMYEARRSEHESIVSKDSFVFSWYYRQYCLCLRFCNLSVVQTVDFCLRIIRKIIRNGRKCKGRNFVKGSGRCANIEAKQMDS
ncbi:GDP-fucose protein O-fucosyltransferase [Dirofilaria immitis]